MKLLRSVRLGSSPAAYVPAPAYPETGGQLWKRLGTRLKSLECSPEKELSQKDLGTLLGVSRSTFNDWCHSNLAPALRHFLCGLERLPEPDRTVLLREFCRECPRLDHPQLTCAPGTLEWLRGVITAPAGLTAITGGTARTRTFLITAIGNSAQRILPGRNYSQISGLDLHCPDWFVPVQGVFYRFQGQSTRAVSSADAWKRVESSGARLLLLNGVWSAMKACQPRILALSRKQNVMIADEFEMPQTSAARINILRIEPARGGRLRLEMMPSRVG